MNTISPAQELKSKMSEGVKISNVSIHYKPEIQQTSLNTELSNYDLNVIYDSNLPVVEATIVFDPNKRNNICDTELTLKKLICDNLHINKENELYSDITTFADYIESLWNINTIIGLLSIKCEFEHKIVNIYITQAAEKNVENVVVTIIDKETDDVVERLIKRYCIKSISIYKEERNMKKLLVVGNGVNVENIKNSFEFDHHIVDSEVNFVDDQGNEFGYALGLELLKRIDLNYLDILLEKCIDLDDENDREYKAESVKFLPRFGAVIITAVNIKERSN